MKTGVRLCNPAPNRGRGAQLRNLLVHVRQSRSMSRSYIDHCTVRLLIIRGLFLLPSKCARKEIYWPGFLDVSRQPIDLLVHVRRVFMCYVNTAVFRCAFLMAICHSRGCMVGCVGRISHTNLKNRMVISRIATSENHIELYVLVLARSYKLCI